MRAVTLAVLLALTGEAVAAETAAATPTATVTPQPESEEHSFWDDPPTPTPAAPTPTPAPTPGPMVAVLVRTTAGGTASDEAIGAGVIASGHRVLAPGVIRAFLAFSSESRSFDDARCHRMRTELTVDRLLVVEVRGLDGGSIAVRMRAFDPGKRLTTRYFEATPSTVDAMTVAAFGELPPVRPPARLVGKIGGLPTGPVMSPRRGENDVPDVRSFGIAPVAVFQPSPPYPAEARYANITGRVTLEITVDPSGRVTRVEPIAGHSPFLAPSIATVSTWRYKPFVIDGVPIHWKSKVTLKFRLTGDVPRAARTPFHGWSPPVLGDSGTHEVGLFAGFGGGSSRTVLVDNADSASLDRNWLLHAFAAAFARNGLELQGRLELEGAADQSRKSKVGLALGLAYFFRPREGWLVGPQVIGGLSSRNGEETRPGGRTASFDGQGATGFGGIAARAPAGRVMLAMEVGGYYRVFGVDYSGATSASGQATESGVRAVAGVSWGSAK